MKDYRSHLGKYRLEKKKKTQGDPNYFFVSRKRYHTGRNIRLPQEFPGNPGQNTGFPISQKTFINFYKIDLLNYLERLKCI